MTFYVMLPKDLKVIHLAKKQMMLQGREYHLDMGSNQ